MLEYRVPRAEARWQNLLEESEATFTLTKKIASLSGGHYPGNSMEDKMGQAVFFSCSDVG